MRLNNLSLGISASALGAALIFSALSMPNLPNFRFGAGLFPGIIGASMILVGILLAATRSAESRPLVSLPEWAGRSEGRRGVLLMLGLLVAYFLLAETVGFIPMALLILTSLLLHKGVRPVLAITIAAAMSLFIVQFFGGVLNVPLPWGWLEPYAGYLSWK